MKIVVCDDYGDELIQITSALKDCEFKGGHSVSAFCDPWLALDYFERGADADVVLLDILMPGLSGISLAETIRGMGFGGLIIFVSTVNNFAAQSYKVNAFSYLLKPLKKSELQAVLSNAESLLRSRDNIGFKLKWRGGGKYVLMSELVYAEVQNHHLFFHMNNNETIKIFGKLSDYSETLLADSRMAHVNRSFIVNMDYISKCEDRAVFLKDGTRISVTQRYAQFQSAYFKWVFGINN